MRLPLVFIACIFAGSVFANDGDKISLADAAQRAFQASSLTSSDGKPFHLRATIAESGDSDSD
jgi:hypothetical protein